MRFIILTIVLTLTVGIFKTLIAQEVGREDSWVLMPLTPQEEIQLQCLPELKMPAGYANRELPYMVDNSTQTYMRPAYQQDGLSCGQASCIGYNFTYEMSRERDLNASLTQNQYPTHFAWNFMNGGAGYYGVSYLHSIQILKEFGMPNVVDYGGAMGYGGPARWMSGYTQYYNGMHNRITNAYQIQVGTPEGLLVLKHWLHSHLEGSTVGGIASFYAQHQSATQMLPYGTQEAGKYVLTTFGGSANHAMTIVGYNDSIRWDYNGDGQYTNNIDINGDNAVNMKDWEIGGFKMVQSYGGVPNWGNLGYAYMMYKTVADNLGSGGIWNHCVHVLDVKESCDPKLTARLILKHGRRKMIKVLAGISNNVNLARPEVILGYPIYDYQGGDNYMQGGTSEEANKTIEIGLDLSKLLTYVDLNQDVKVFLQVVEDDPGNTFTGDIIHFSIYDHTAGGSEINCSQSNVPLINDDTTTLSITHTFNFNRVSILDETIPPAPEGEYYSYQLTASGGTEPYIWEFDKTYGETSQTASFPQVTATQLAPSNNTSGFVTQPIEFAFPFFDTAFTSITVHVDGYLMFDEQLYPFPYYQDDKVLFNITRNISPFLNQHQELNGSQGGGIWYEGDEQSATFRWKTSLTEDPAMNMNYAVRLYPDGTIKFYYGPMNGCDEFLWMSGISDGDNFNYQTTSISGKPTITANSSTTLLPYDYPPEMELSDNGLFFGTPAQSYGNEQITFKVTDNNFIYTTKTFTFSSSGIIVQDSVISGGDAVIAFGETAWMNISVLNVRSATVPNATMTIHIDDPYITVADSTENLGNLEPGILKKFFNAYHFIVAEDVPNDHLITIVTTISSDTNSWESSIFHRAYAPVVAAEDVVVNDENGRLDAGETTDLTVSILNTGGIGVTSLYTVLSTSDPYITINQSFGNIPLLEVGQSADVTFNLTVSEDCPPGHLVDFTVDMMGDGNYAASDSFSLGVGLYLENFESGDLHLFSWGHDGTREWKIDTFSPYEGSFCSKSGIITHNEESVMRIDANVISDGEISFYERTSCENDPSPATDYDYLCFLIDGAEMGRWDSVTVWSLQQYPVSAGFHRFEWIYRKDQNTSYQFDAAWVDFITFPSATICSPAIMSGPASFNFMMKPGESETDALLLFNPAAGGLKFSADIAGLDPYAREIPPGGRNIEGSYLVSDAEKFNTEQEYIWNLRTYNAGSDNEWIKQIYISFPQGAELVAASDFVGGSGGNMVFDGQFGNGVTAHWFGEDTNGWGVVHMGEMAICNVSVIPHTDIQEDIAIYYEVDGEVYGGTPHIVYGTIPMRNLGPVTSWLSLDTTSGILPGGMTDSLILSVNTAGMEDGNYQAWIILQDNFESEVIIPVNLTVDTYMDASGPVYNQASDKFSAFPNPFQDKTTLSILLPEKSMIRFEISTLQGQSVKAFSSQAEANVNHQITWDGMDNNGNPVPAGIYLGRLVAGDRSYFVKLILTR
jgi:hypothetical protein